MNEELANSDINSDNDVAELQAIVSSLAKVEAADDYTTKTVDVTDLTNIGVSIPAGVTIAAINDVLNDTDTTVLDTAEV